MSKFDKQKYDSEYAKKNYDRFIFNAPKGTKEPLNEYWKSQGFKSLNDYIASLIQADLQQALKSINENTRTTADIALENILKKNRNTETTDYIVDLGDGNTILIEQVPLHEENRPE